MNKFAYSFKAGLSLLIVSFLCHTLYAQNLAKEDHRYISNEYNNQQYFDSINHIDHSQLKDSVLSTYSSSSLAGFVRSDSSHISSLKTQLVNVETAEIAQQTFDEANYQICSSSTIIPDVCFIEDITGTITWKPVDNLRFRFAISGVRMYTNTGIYNDMALSFSSHIPVYNKFSMNVYGGYSFNSFIHSGMNSPMYEPFVPKTYFGGSLEYAITKHIGVEVGVLLNYNSVSKNWETMYITSPTVPY